MRRTMLAVLAAGAMIVSAGTAGAEEAKLKLVRFASEDTPYTKTIAKLVDLINKDGKGLVQVASVVGPEAVPVNQMGTALKNGIVDVIIVPPSYVSNLQRGLQGLSATRFSPQEERKNGTYDLVNDAIAKSLNAIMIGQLGWGTDFNFFMRAPLTSIDQFKGKRVRTSNTFRRFIEALGAQPFQASRSEIYTAMERGVLDGFVNQKMEVLSAGWGKVASYMINPSFYNGMAIVVVNLNTWKKFDDKQRAFMQKIGVQLENDLSPWMAEQNRTAQAELVKGGMKVIELPPDQAKTFEKMAYDSTWDEIEKVAPGFGTQLRKVALGDK